MSDDAAQYGDAVECILCDHEGHEEDGVICPVDGDWYCDVCEAEAPGSELPLVTDGGRAEHTDGADRGLEAMVFDRPVFETQWQIPLELPGLPTILLQQTESERWNNHDTRVVVDGVAHPAPHAKHQAHEQLVSTISHVVEADDDRTEKTDAVGTDVEQTEKQEREKRTEPKPRTEQEGLDAFA